MKQYEQRKIGLNNELKGKTVSEDYGKNRRKESSKKPAQKPLSSKSYISEEVKISDSSEEGEGS